MGYLCNLYLLVNLVQEVVVALPLDDPSSDLENALQKKVLQTRMDEMDLNIQALSTMNELVNNEMLTNHGKSKDIFHQNLNA